jgi:hypothetical protein
MSSNLDERDAKAQNALVDKEKVVKSLKWRAS